MSGGGCHGDQAGLSWFATPFVGLKSAGLFLIAYFRLRFLTQPIKFI